MHETATGSGIDHDDPHTPQVQGTDDGTPRYNDTVTASYRRLQYRTSVYAERPKRGSGLRLGIYQAEAACGEGEKVDGRSGRTYHFDSIAVIDENGRLLDSYRRPQGSMR